MHHYFHPIEHIWLGMGQRRPEEYNSNSLHRHSIGGVLGVVVTKISETLLKHDIYAAAIKCQIVFLNPLKHTQNTHELAHFYISVRSFNKQFQPKIHPDMHVSQNKMNLIWVSATSLSKRKNNLLEKL